MKKALIVIAIVGLFCALTLYFVFRTSEDAAVKIEFGDIGRMAQGDPFDLEVSVLSEEAKVLKNAKLAVFLPTGIFFVGDDEGQRVEEKILGDVGPGSLSKEVFSLIAMGETGEKKLFKAKLTYAIAPNEKTIFEIEKDFEIELGDAAVGLEIETPEEVSSGEVFEFKVKYKNISGKDLGNLSLKIDYPPVFKLKESSIKPDKGENEWEILLLGKGEEREFTVLGSVAVFLGASFEIPVSILGNFEGQQYTLYSEKKEVKIAEAPLSVAIEIVGSSGLRNSEGGYVIRRGETFKCLLKYKNNSDTGLNNVQVKVKLSGEAYDFSRVRTNGNFNSFDKTVVWNSLNTPELLSVSAGAGGSLELEAGARSDLAITRLGDKNFSLKAEAEIRSANSPSGLVGLISLARIETRMAGEAVVDARAFFRDAKSGILNSGDFPLRVGQATELTIHWVLKNYYNDISSAELSARLPSGAKWTGQTKSNSTNQPTYDEGNNLVRWKIDRVIATKGVISDPFEAVFQVRVTPTMGQVGQVLDLLGPTDFVAHDDFADVTIATSDVKLDTNLPDDSTVTNTLKTVQP